MSYTSTAPDDQPFTDTLSLLSQIITPDPAVLERERILPPGAGGEHGGPYKMLRTQVLRRLDKLGANSLAVIGTAQGTGRTLTAINLAIAIAADPQRTALLVDLDLRRPRVHRRFGFEPRIGVEDCLRRNSPLREAMVRPARLRTPGAPAGPRALRGLLGAARPPSALRK